jgi:prepilin-type N-terminal cleavage/methylation domain-containing protein
VHPELLLGLKKTFKRATMHSSSKSGFSLIELLVVVGLMALILAGIGIVQLNQSPGSRLKGAERMLVGKLKLAQNHSKISGNPTRFIVSYDVQNHLNLRRFGVVEEISGVWTVVGGINSLPRSIYFVPASSADIGGAWQGPLSVYSNNNQTFNYDPDGRGSVSHTFVEFSPSGRLDSLVESEYAQSDINSDSLSVELYLSMADLDGENQLAFRYSDLIAGVHVAANGGISSIQIEGE